MRNRELDGIELATSGSYNKRSFVVRCRAERRATQAEWMSGMALKLFKDRKLRKEAAEKPTLNNL